MDDWEDGPRRGRGGGTARERMARRILDAIAAERLAGASVFERASGSRCACAGGCRPAGAGCPERPAGAGADMEHAGPSAALRRCGYCRCRRCTIRPISALPVPWPAGSPLTAPGAPTDPRQAFAMRAACLPGGRRLSHETGGKISIKAVRRRPLRIPQPRDRGFSQGDATIAGGFLRPAPRPHDPDSRTGCA